MLLAYSTVAQIGYLFLVFPLAGTAAAQTAWLGLVVLMASHALAKSAMFLAAGNVLRHHGHDRIEDLDHLAAREPATLFAFALAGVSLIGLPPSGGFTAKWLLIQAAIESGQWWWVLVMALGALFAAGYVFRVLGHAFTSGNGGTQHHEVAPAMTAAALILALCAVAVGFLTVYVEGLRRIGWPDAALTGGLS